MSNTDRDIRKANQAIADLIEIAESSLKEAAQIADKFGITFRWSGPAYGMGGSYTAKKEVIEDDDWSSSTGWNSSSSQC